MKKKILTMLATAVLGCVVFSGCNSEPEVRVDPPMLSWQGDHCPVTGKKYSSVPESMDGELGETELIFEHEGTKYEVTVWNEEALAEFNKNKDKYIEAIIANSK